MPNSVSRPTLTRRRFTQLSGMAVGSLALSSAARAASADVTLEIAPYTLEASPKHHIRTVAYNGQIPVVCPIFCTSVIVSVVQLLS